MEPIYEINMISKPMSAHIDIIRKYVLSNNVTTPGYIWSAEITSGSDLDSLLPCQWEGDTEQTPISLAEMFPAEYAYLKAKLQPEG